MQSNRRSSTSALLLLALSLLAGGAVAQQPPINVLFDLHHDPLSQALPLPQRLARWNELVANTNWVLDQVEPYGVKLAHTSVGEAMEFTVDGGYAGPGATLLRRIYAAGGQVGTHSHNEHQAGPHSWPPYVGLVTFAQAADSWNDHVAMVNAAIAVAFPTLPEPLSAINGVRGAHIPSNETDFHALMAAHGFLIRQPGPEEDYYAYANHHIWNPYRPSAANALTEDLAGSFVQPTSGPVIGLAQVHHGIYQDMTVPNVKRMFLQCYLSWRYANRLRLPPKVWNFGWGSHSADFDTTDPSRAAILGIVPWIANNFIGVLEPNGAAIARWSTHRDVADEYFAWESANPGVSSWPFTGTFAWDTYPYLRAVAEELVLSIWQDSPNLGAGIKAHRLTRGSRTMLVLWSDTVTTTLDVSAITGTNVRVVSAETGVTQGFDSTAVAVSAEPVIVTNDIATLTVLGPPQIGTTFALRLQAATTPFAAIFGSPSPASLIAPYVGIIGIDPSSALVIGAGPLTAPPGFYQLDIALPNDPSLIGFTGHLQGLVSRFGGESFLLTSTAPSITIF